MAEKDLYYTGGTIIMDHGHGISTIYSHLASLNVKVGDEVLYGKYSGTEFRTSSSSVLNSSLALFVLPPTTMAVSS